MRHLRRYNEAVYGVEGVEEFCANYLANLLDDTDYGFNVRSTMTTYRASPSYIFLLFCNVYYYVIEWDNVKDHVIPFLHMLMREYRVEPLPYYEAHDYTTYRYIDKNPRNRTIRFKTGPESYYYTSIENAINDKDVPENFIQIQIQFY
jgi:hypothetical protein